MVKFTAGRFAAEIFPDENSDITLLELHPNGSGEQIGSIKVSIEDISDLKHVLDRATVVVTSNNN